MKTGIFNLCRKNAIGILFLLFLYIPNNTQAQKGIEISLSAYPGYTAVNF